MKKFPIIMLLAATVSCTKEYTSSCVCKNHLGETKFSETRTFHDRGENEEYQSDCGKKTTTTNSYSKHILISSSVVPCEANEGQTE